MQRNPHPFLDKLMEIFKVNNDKDLAQHLEVSCGSISRIRGGTQVISPQLILNVYDQTFLTIEEIRTLIKESQKD